MEVFGVATEAARADLACEEEKKKRAVGDDGSLRGVRPGSPLEWIQMEATGGWRVCRAVFDRWRQMRAAGLAV